MKLHARTWVKNINEPIIGKIVTADGIVLPAGNSLILLCKEKSVPPPTANCLAILTTLSAAEWRANDVSIAGLPTELSYLSDGDVLRISPDGSVQVLYRRDSPHNSILVTEQCNSYCLMCSQPPRKIDDYWRLEEIHRLIDLIDPQTKELGFTGGEPFLCGQGMFSLISHCKERLPDTAVHILTNGRPFADSALATQLAAINHPNLMLGIPLYSDIETEHNFVVQAEGAFDETVRGLYNLARCDIPIEIRVVLHKQTIGRLKELSEYIARNFPFVCQVALMGLENMGFARTNMKDLWIDPVDYQDALYAATEHLWYSGMRVWIYNLQLCVLDRRLWRFAARSISDWKNAYLPECAQCSVRELCAGFFESCLKLHSRGIRPEKTELTWTTQQPRAGSLEA